MVAVGGLTRLTESGLSIVKWEPIHGTIPPLNAEEWEEEFSSYKASPEYIKKNYGMSLEEFKFIFWWEFTHRLIGRLLGVIFFIPFIYFAAKKQITIRRSLTLLGIFALGGVQGFIGWWMVKSGLVDNPAVSHYRLALHLSVALLIFSLLFWQALGFYFSGLNNGREKNKAALKLSNLLIFAVAVQIIFGAFMAGLDAGLTYNTWPLMDGKVIPAGIKMILNNIEFIQFFHRWWAFVVMAVAIFFLRKVKSRKIIFEDEITNVRLRKGLKIFHALIGTQIIIGIFTLIYVVPVPLASVHQIMAVLVLAVAVYIRRVAE